MTTENREFLHCGHRGQSGASGSGVQGALLGKPPSYAPDRAFDACHIFLDLEVDLRPSQVRTRVARAPRPEPGEDKSGPSTHAEPGDDKSRPSTQAEPGDDKSRPSTHAEPGDDKSGPSTQVRSGSGTSGRMSTQTQATDDKVGTSGSGMVDDGGTVDVNGGTNDGAGHP